MSLASLRGLLSACPRGCNSIADHQSNTAIGLGLGPEGHLHGTKSESMRRRRNIVTSISAVSQPAVCVRVRWSKRQAS